MAHWPTFTIHQHESVTCGPLGQVSVQRNTAIALLLVPIQLRSAHLPSLPALTLLREEQIY